MDYTVVVVVEGNAAPGLVYVTPYAAQLRIEPVLMRSGRDVRSYMTIFTAGHRRAFAKFLLLRGNVRRAAKLFPAIFCYSSVARCWNV